MATEAQRAIEAILMVADQPVDPGLLSQLLEIPPGQVEEICEELGRAYDDADRGFVIARVAGGYRFQSHPDLAPYIERFVLEGQTARLSAAALETLAIVAYKQPVSRAQISAIRGVNADGVLRTLEQRGYVAEVGRDPGPGQAVLYGTTPTLLERLGLDSTADLPPLADFVPGAEIMEALEHSLRLDDDRRAETAATATAGPPDDAGTGRGSDTALSDTPLSDTPLSDTPLSDTARSGTGLSGDTGPQEIGTAEPAPPGPAPAEPSGGMTDPAAVEAAHSGPGAGGGPREDAGAVGTPDPEAGGPEPGDWVHAGGDDWLRTDDDEWLDDGPDGHPAPTVPGGDAASGPGDVGEVDLTDAAVDLDDAWPEPGGDGPDLRW